MQNKFIKALSVCLIVLSLAGVLFGVYSAGVNVDYSRPGSTVTTTLNSGDIFDLGLPYHISEAEKNYLNLYSDFSVTHPTNISTSYVKTDFDKNTGVLSLTASPHSYLLEDGTEVVWIPERAILRGQTRPLTQNGEEYVATFTSVTEEDENVVEVIFSYDIEVDKDAVNGFINKAYFDAPTLKAEHERLQGEYESKLAEYEQNKIDYEAYIKALSEYNAKYELYTIYLQQKRIYDEQYSAYQAYLKDLEQYEKDAKEYAAYEKELEKYNKDYDSYLKYLANADKYDAEVLAYQKYVRDMEIVKAQLKIIDQTKTPVTSLKRTLYSDIMGETVATVIANKDLLTTTIGANGEAVDRAGIATSNLRTLLGQYFACKTESEKYTYYSINYEGFRDNFAELLRSLDKLHTAKLRGLMIAEDKNEKYIILIAELYLIVNALSDEPVLNYDGNGYFDKNFLIGSQTRDKRKPTAVVTEKDFMVDKNNAKPLVNGYPVKVEKPEELVVVEPVRPANMPKPVKPEEVKKPTAPKEVKEPVRPNEVIKLSEPEKYVPKSEIIALISEYEGGNLSERPLVTENIFITREITVSKRFIGATEVNVVFHDTNGNAIYETVADKGTYADFVGQIPTKEEDVSATYAFIGWADAEGNLKDLTRVESDLLLYPKFEATLKKYPITWIVEGKSYVDMVEYGSVPKCNVPLVKESTDSTYFVFDAFDKPVEAVTGAATYVARFNEKYFFPISDKYGAKVTYKDGVCYANAIQSSLAVYDIGSLLDEIAGKTSLVITTRTGVMKFSFADTLALKNENVRYVKLAVKMIGSGGYSYSVSLFDGEYNELDKNIRVDLELPCVFADTVHMILYYQSGDDNVSVKHTVENKKLRFNALCGTKYEAVIEYKITVVPCEELSLSVDREIGKFGSVVNVDYKLPKGILLTGGTYYITESGEKVYFDGHFTLEGNVTVGIDYEYVEYTVTFVSDGKVISVATYHYGDMPAVPVDPQKASTDKFLFKFVGWDKKILPVTEDVTYEAEYWCNPVLPEIKDGPQISEPILKLLLLGVSSVAVVLLGGVPCIVLSIIFAKKRKQKCISCDKNGKTL